MALLHCTEVVPAGAWAAGRLLLLLLPVGGEGLRDRPARQGRIEPSEGAARISALPLLPQRLLRDEEAGGLQNLIVCRRRMAPNAQLRPRLLLLLPLLRRRLWMRVMALVLLILVYVVVLRCRGVSLGDLLRVVGMPFITVVGIRNNRVATPARRGAFT